MQYFRMSTFCQSIFKVLVYVSLIWTGIGTQYTIYTVSFCIIMFQFFAVNMPGVTSQVTLITDSLETGQSVCPGENITFYCTVNLSQTLFWSSDEYIGPDGEQLEFSNHSTIGVRVNSTVNPDTLQY